MTVDARRRQQVVFDLLQIGVADAAGFHANQQSRRGRSRAWGPARRHHALALVHSGVHGCRERRSQNRQSAKNSPSVREAARLRLPRRSNSGNKSTGRRQAAAIRLHCTESAVGKERRIEVQMKTFAGQIGNRFYAIKRQMQLRCLGGNAGRFHLHRGGPPRAQLTLLFDRSAPRDRSRRACPSHAGARTAAAPQRIRPCRFARRSATNIEPTVIPSSSAPQYPMLQIHSILPKELRDIHGLGRSRRARPVRHQQHFASIHLRRSRPVNGPCERPYLPAKLQEPAELARLGRDQQ